MSRLQGFGCQRCRLELLARPPEQTRDATDWLPPVLCCGMSPRPLASDQGLAAPRLRRRDVRCPGCGYRVQLVVWPAGPLVCAACRQALTGAAGAPRGPAPGEGPTGEEVLRHDLIVRLIAQGPDRFACHIYRRLCADRTRVTPSAPPCPLEWAALAHWARLEGLVTEAEARLLTVPPPRPPPSMAGAVSRTRPHRARRPPTTKP